MQRILIIKLSSMGDVLHAVPVLSDIKQALGEDTQIDWITEPNYACLLKDHPHIHQLHTLPLRKYKSFFKGIRSQEAKQLKQLLKKHPYDAILDLQGLLKSAWVSKWTKGKTYGYDNKSIREPLASWLYQNKVTVSKDLHAITRMRELAAKALGYMIPTNEPDYALNTHSSVNSRQQLILFPFTTWESKHWPKEHWQKLIALAAPNYKIFIAWGSTEELAQAKQLYQPHTNCQPTPDLNIEGMKDFLQHCDAFIGVDTGFAHLATAMAIPGIMLMGPTDKNKSGPLGKHQIALDVSLPCRPCHKRTCVLPMEPNTLRPACLAAIQPEFVFNTLKKIINDKA